MYRNLKDVLEAAVFELSETDQVIGRFNTSVKEEIDRLRGGTSENQVQGQVEPNRLNGVANLLVATFKRTRVSTRFYASQ